MGSRSEWFFMKDKGHKKGTGQKTDSPDANVASVAGGKATAPGAASVVMTSKEKIAANQRNKRRK